MTFLRNDWDEVVKYCYTNGSFFFINIYNKIKLLKKVRVRKILRSTQPKKVESIWLELMMCKVDLDPGPVESSEQRLKSN